MTRISKLLEDKIREELKVGQEAGKYFTAIKIEGIDSDEFLRNFAGKVKYRAKIDEFKAKAKTYDLDTKGKKTLPQIKKFIKEYNPKEYYIVWKDSSNYHDDSIVVYYTV